MTTLATIVEGHGEDQAVPVLLRRIVADLKTPHPIQVIRPLRTSRSRLLKTGELERAVDFSSRRAGPHGAVLILLDADDDCAAELATSLLTRANGVRTDGRIGVVLAKFEFEAWFIASIESLRGNGASPWMRRRPMIRSPFATRKVGLAT
jgi:hypothetical protein